MGRASYQNIDNIVIGNKKAVSLTLVKKNHKKVRMCVPVGATFSPQSTAYSLPKPVRETLRLKI
jgi:hypothetical protein